MEDTKVKEIINTLNSPGWLILEQEIQSKIVRLKNGLETDEFDISNVEVMTKGKVKIVVINKNYNRHEIKILQQFLSKINCYRNSIIERGEE